MPVADALAASLPGRPVTRGAGRARRRLSSRAGARRRCAADTTAAGDVGDGRLCGARSGCPRLLGAAEGDRRGRRRPPVRAQGRRRRSGADLHGGVIPMAPTPSSSRKTRPRRRRHHHQGSRRFRAGYPRCRRRFPPGRPAAQARAPPHRRRFVARRRHELSGACSTPPPESRGARHRRRVGDAGRNPGPGQIVYSNGYALRALARAEGAEVVDLGIAADTVAATAQGIRRAREAARIS